MSGKGEEFSETEAASLEETRLGVLERRIQADLALHRHGDILGELTMLAARHPMNENFRGFLMIALYRAGHVARALEAFQQLRTILGDELGIDPSPWTRGSTRPSCPAIRRRTWMLSSPRTEVRP